MTSPTPASSSHTPSDFGTAIRNRKIQMLTGTLAAALAGTGIALAAQAAGPAITDRAQIEQIVHDYILEHPEILPEAMERLQSKRTGAIISEKRTDIETPYAGGWEGAANADVVLVEFFDYACGYCRAMVPDLTKLVSEDKSLKIVYRELPILSDESASAAKVSLLAAERGQYMKYHKALYAGGPITKDSILAAAAGVGIDRKSAETAIADKRFAPELEKNIRLAQALGASGTPTFVVGNQVLNGAVGYDELKKAVAKAREDKK